MSMDTCASDVAGWSPIGLRRGCPVYSGTHSSLSILKISIKNQKIRMIVLELPHHPLFLHLCPVTWVLQPQMPPAVCPGTSHPALSHLTFLICMLAQQWYVAPRLAVSELTKKCINREWHLLVLANAYRIIMTMMTVQTPSIHFHYIHVPLCM